MKPSELLRRAVAKMPTSDRWCKGELARDKDGRLSRLSNAHSYCMIGAMHAVCDDIGIERAGGPIWSKAKQALENVVDDAKYTYSPRLITGFNDAKSTTYTDVMQAFSKAIESLEKVNE